MGGTLILQNFDCCFTTWKQLHSLFRKKVFMGSEKPWRASWSHQHLLYTQKHKHCIPFFPLTKTERNTKTRNIQKYKDQLQQITDAKHSTQAKSSCDNYFVLHGVNECISTQHIDKACHPSQKGGKNLCTDYIRVLRSVP